MKTVAEWIAEIKASPEALSNWLQRQYVGEALAHKRILQLYRNSVDEGFPKAHQEMLRSIAGDEWRHSVWIENLLKNRGIQLPEVTIEGTRYWGPVMNGIDMDNFEEVAAAGHHAETMRLERIRALANDEEIDLDIREAFLAILPDETFHAEAFAKMTTPEAIEKMLPLHEEGMRMLGLVL